MFVIRLLVLSCAILATDAILSELLNSTEKISGYVISTVSGTIQNVLDSLGPTIEALLKISQEIISPEWIQEQKNQLSLPSITIKPLICDFIIIGGGAAGSVLAGRLSEVSEWTVCVFEVGLPETPIHALSLPIWTSTNYFWGDLAEPQDQACLGMENNQCRISRGKCLGGGTCINGLLATRGSRHDYDRMSSEFGIPGWSYEEVLPYFKKLETATNVQRNDGPTSRGFEGPVSIETSNYESKAADSLVNAMQAADYKFIDYNGASYIGTSYTQTHTKRGLRVSAARAYVYPNVWQRPNLKVMVGVEITKILFDSANRAYAVEYKGLLGLLTLRCEARKEIILSAGTLGSPKVLMLSGVGPKPHLESLGIPVLIDLPVGQNLHDHPMYYSLMVLTNLTGEVTTLQTMILNQYGDTPLEQIPILDAVVNGKGALTTQAIAFGLLNTQRVREANRTGQCATEPSGQLSEDITDIEYQMNFLAFPTDPITQEASKGYLNVRDSTLEDMRRDLLPYAKNDILSVLTVLLNSKSTGKVELRDTNPKSLPKIYLNFFDDPRDIETLLIGIREFECLLGTAPFRAINASLACVKYANCASLECFSDEYWRCTMRQMTMSGLHYTGTCKMGAEGDASAVVDPRFRVRGATGLRVCDASVFPHPTSAHLAIPAMMLGERCADFIKQDLGK